MVDKVSWLNMSHTVELIDELTVSRELIKEQLAEGASVGETVDQTALLTVRYSATSQVLGNVINLIQHMPVKEEVEDEDDEGATYES